MPAPSMVEPEIQALEAEPGGHGFYREDDPALWDGLLAVALVALGLILLAGVSLGIEIVLH